MSRGLRPQGDQSPQTVRSGVRKESKNAASDSFWTLFGGSGPQGPGSPLCQAGGFLTRKTLLPARKALETSGRISGQISERHLGNFVVRHTEGRGCLGEGRLGVPGQVWEFRFCCFFLHFLGKIAIQEMSGKTPGSPRHPSSRHPRPSERHFGNFVVRHTVHVVSSLCLSVVSALVNPMCTPRHHTLVSSWITFVN